MDVESDKKRPSIAYFSMEYGLNQVLKIYSGGLGVLAGDYLKEASDSNVDLCAVGFLYRYGYFTQTLSMDGKQIANYEATELFRDLDPALWKEVGHNPVLLLERMSYAKLEALANDKVILKRMNDVYSKFRDRKSVV